MVFLLVLNLAHNLPFVQWRIVQNGPDFALLSGMAKRSRRAHIG
jgi:hypothetical protein